MDTPSPDQKPQPAEDQLTNTPRRNLVPVILVIVLIIGGVLAANFWRNTEDTPPSESETVEPITTSPAARTPTPTSDQPPTISSTTHKISYTNDQYVPDTISIQSGDTVEFVNNSTQNIWPASDSHPSHTDYPGFDPLTTVAPGESWSFTFTKTGTWRYHDHLRPRSTGTIVVN